MDAERRRRPRPVHGVFNATGQPRLVPAGLRRRRPAARRPARRAPARRGDAARARRPSSRPSGRGPTAARRCERATLLASPRGRARRGGAVCSSASARAGREARDEVDADRPRQRGRPRRRARDPRAAAERRPDDGILGEEGDDVPGHERAALDRRPARRHDQLPLGIPQWCVSVACEDARRRRPRPAARRAVRGRRAAGRRAQRRRALRPQRRDDLAPRWSPPASATTRACARAGASRRARVLPRVRDIRRAGSAALDLAWTAAGRFDAYYERGVKRWDVAAGALLCARAGLEVRDLPARDGLPPGARRAAGDRRRAARARRVEHSAPARGGVPGGWDSNPHALAGNGVLRPRVYQFRHPGRRVTSYAAACSARLGRRARRRLRPPLDLDVPGLPEAAHREDDEQHLDRDDAAA